jgi:hypothetical protein
MELWWVSENGSVQAAFWYEGVPWQRYDIRNRATQFIHNKDADTVGDCIFPEQCDKGGAAYAPYLSDVRVNGQQVSMTYTLSTWNPYQVMRMRHVVNLAELKQLEEM